MLRVFYFFRVKYFCEELPVILNAVPQQKFAAKAFLAFVFFASLTACGFPYDPDDPTARCFVSRMANDGLDRGYTGTGFFYFPNFAYSPTPECKAVYDLSQEEFLGLLPSKVDRVPSTYYIIARQPKPASPSSTSATSPKSDSVRQANAAALITLGAAIANAGSPARSTSSRPVTASPPAPVALSVPAKQNCPLDYGSYKLAGDGPGDGLTRICYYR